MALGKKAKKKKEEKKPEAEKQEGAAQQQQPPPPGPQFAIQRIYVKDLSFETPSSPKVFLQEWKPNVNIDLQTKSATIEDGTHEVVLSVTVTAKLDETVAFLAEVQQAGIFTAQDVPEKQLKHMLGSFCPNLLFPYAREVVSDLIGRGGFPQMYLAPINFEALYQQQLAEQQKAQEKEK